MLWLVAASFAVEGTAGLATLELATIEGCDVASHEVTLHCKKGACTLDETISLADPTCAARVAYDGRSLDGAPEPLVRVAEGMALPRPCESGRVCVSAPAHPIEVHRVVALSAGESTVGLLLLDGSVEPTVETTLESRRGDGVTAVVGAPALKKPVELKVPKAMRTARPTSVDYYGTVTSNLRDGVWEERHAARYPIAREVVYAEGIRVSTGDWEAHTVVNDEGIARRVTELGECPREANIETSSGGFITQSCTWTDEDGSHVLVASFRTDPWMLVSIGGAVNGRRDGEARDFWPSGALKERATYFENRKVGLAQRWHETGELAGETRYRPDGGVISERAWSQSGITTMESDRVPGMGANLWVRRYEGGRLVELREPIDALQTRVHRLEGGVWEVQVEAVRRTPPPYGACFADIDCEEGVCVSGTCGSLPDPEAQFRRTGWFSPNEAAVQALGEHGRAGWVRSALFGGEGGCVQAVARPGVSLTLDSALGTVSIPVGLTEEREGGVVWSTSLTERTASCVPATAYVSCGRGTYRACASGKVEVHVVDAEPAAVRTRPPGQVAECDAACPASTCEEEAGRLAWLLAQRRLPAGPADPVTLFWDQAACEAN